MLAPSDIKKILKKLLFRGGDFAELYFENTLETSITFDDKRVEEINSGVDQGAGLRIIHGPRSLYGFTNSISKKSFEEIAGQLSQAVSGTALNQKISFKKQTPKIAFDVIQDPASAPLKQKAALCSQASELAWSLDKRVSQVQITYRESKRSFQIYNSDGLEVEDSKQHISLVVSVTAEHHDEMFTSHDAVSGHCGLEILSEQTIENLVKDTVKRALINLTARRMHGGKMPVIISGAGGGTIIHEAVGHGLEADLVCDGMSVYKNKLGDKVASDKVTVVDDATLPQKSGSFRFDDEGTPSQRTVLIEKGVLKNYLCDRISARKLGLKPTGNARRESYEHRPIVRMTNTFLQPGNNDAEGMIRSVKKGLFVKKMGGGQVNTVNGDFVFEVVEGYLIQNGKICEPVKNATLAGNGPHILKSIGGIAADIVFASGMCGKNDQSVPVTDATPSLLIPEITVGGEVGG